jgi:hypothetical protein
MEDMIIENGPELLFENNIAYMPEHGIIVSMQSSSAATKPGDQPAAAPTNGTITNLTNNSTEIKVANWGDDNDFPGMIKKLLASDAEMKALIDFCVRASYGKGIVCLNEVDIDDDGNPKYKAIIDPAITAWYKSPQTRKYCLEAFIDLFTFFNVFPEMIPSRDRTKINYIGVNEAMHCRWAMMGDDGKLSKLIVNKNWPGAKLDDPLQTTIITAIDPYDYDIVNLVKNDKSLKKFVFPLNYPTIGQTYYQAAHWDGLRLSGWLEIAAQIPAFKKALLKNQMTIKYLIRIPTNYWPAVYKDWDKLSEKAQDEKKKAKLKEINASLTDVKNTGKSILNEVGYDPVTKEKLPGWEIDVIDDKTKAGAFLEDSQEASAHKMRALGLDPTLVGTLITGKGMGAGSGSDKQLAWNIMLAMIDTYRQIVLDPLHFKAAFDDGVLTKYPGFTLRFRDSIMETVNGHNQNVKETLT